MSGLTVSVNYTYIIFYIVLMSASEFAAISEHLFITAGMAQCNEILLIIIYISDQHYISISCCIRRAEIYFLEQSLYEINGASGKLIINLKYSTVEPRQQKG